MSIIAYTPLTDGSTAVAAGVNTPLSTIYNDYNGNITNANIASNAAIAISKLAATPAISSSSNLGSRSQALTASAGASTAYSTNNPTLTLTAGKYLLVAVANARAVISTQDSTFNAVIYNDTGSAEVASNGTASTGISTTLYPTYSVLSIVTPVSTTTYSGRVSQTFGTGAVYSFVNSTLIAIPFLT